MKPGDGLVTIQEVGVFPKLRRHLARSFPPRPQRFELGHLESSRIGWSGGGDLEPSQATSYSKLVFGDRGRAFEALIYIKGPVTPTLRGEVEAILDSLRFS